MNQYLKHLGGKSHLKLNFQMESLQGNLPVIIDDHMINIISQKMKINK